MVSVSFSQTPFHFFFLFFLFRLLLCLPDQSSRIFLVHDVCLCAWTWPRVASMSCAKPQTPLVCRV